MHMSKSVLVFAPHNDDEVLGVGGTIVKMAKAGYNVTVCEVTSGKNPDRVNLIKQEAYAAHKLLGVENTVFLDLPVVALNGVPKAEINSKLVEVVQSVKPSVVFLPHRGDMHLDHRVLTDAAMVALRPIEAPFVEDIFAYETLSETEWNVPTVDNVFMPAVWSDISNELDIKLAAMACYNTQLCAFPHPRSLEAIKALAVLRGSTIGVNAAEAFVQIRRKI